MKRLFICFALFLISPICLAKYEPLTLYHLAIQSDKVVVGTIVDESSEFFTIQIERSLDNDWGFLTIRKFQDWTCAARWTPYEVGQRLLFFLVQKEGVLYTLGAGNEGEMPLNDEKVYIPDQCVTSYTFLNTGQGSAQEEEFEWGVKPRYIFGGRFHGFEHKLSDLLELVERIRSCFWIDEGSEWPYEKGFRCEEEKLKQLSEKSQLFRWAYLDFKSQMKKAI